MVHTHRGVLLLGSVEVNLRPYKFSLTVHRLSGLAAIHSAYRVKASLPGCVYRYAVGEVVTYRIDFIHDGNYERSRRVRRELNTYMLDVPAYIRTGQYLLVVWTTDDSWLAMEDVPASIREWNDAREPDKAWAAVERALS